MIGMKFEMLLQRNFALWELGALFRCYHERILGREPLPNAAVPVEAVDGLEGRRALIARPGKGKTPCGLVTWSPRGDSWWIDFIYSSDKSRSRNEARGAELLMGLWQHLLVNERARSIKCAFARELVASDDDFFSPMAERLGMERDDDLLLTLRSDEDFLSTPAPAGLSLRGWHDGLLDEAIAVMKAAPDPSRLGDWSEQRCRDEINWSAAGSTPGFGDERAVSAWHGKRLVAFAVATEDGLITQIHVLPEFQNRGLGTALLSSLVERLRAKGLDEVSIIIGDTNGEALRLAERVGFVDELRYPLWHWCRTPLNLDGVDFLWNSRLSKGELSDLFFRCSSLRAFDPSALMASFKGSRTRLVVRHLGQLLAVARAVGDGASFLFVADLLVDPAFRFQGLGRTMVEAFRKRFSGMDEIMFGCGRDLNPFFASLGMKKCEDVFSGRGGSKS